MKKHSLFNNYYGENYDFDEIKKYLEEECDETNVTDNRVWDEISSLESEDYAYALDVLKSVEKNNDGMRWICNGTFGLWSGRTDAAAIFEDTDELLGSITKDCDNIKIEFTMGGRLFVTASHHDGTNYFELKLINDKGYQCYCDKEWNCTKKPTIDLMDKLFNNPRYTKLPHINRFM